jgi:hypothetical protein
LNESGIKVIEEKYSRIYLWNRSEEIRQRIISESLITVADKRSPSNEEDAMSQGGLMVRESL